MRLITLLITTLSPLAVCYSQGVFPKPFHLSGDVAAIKGKVVKVYLSYTFNGQRISDSVKVKNARYAFSGRLLEPVLARMNVVHEGGIKQGSNRPEAADLAVIFLQPGSIRVTSTGSFSNIKVTGSRAHDEYAKLEQLLQADEDRMDKLSAIYNKLYKNKDGAGMRAMEPKFTEVEVSMKKTYKKYLEENTSSPIAIYALQRFAGWDIDPNEVSAIFELLPNAIKNSPSGKDLKGKIAIAEKTAVGQLAMDFTQNDTLGKPVSLSSLKGNYLLLDFWASWCGPCRAENPNIVNAFNQYKSRGFSVLGVSLDRPNGKEKWMKAIHDDGLWWTHVSDLQFWQNAVAVQYGIKAIPHNLLLDPEGRIIAKNLRGDELHKKLEEIFDR